VGNKSDAQTQRVVEESEGQKIANSYNVPFYECSCKSNLNVQQIFLEIANLISIQWQQNVRYFP
jgi:Rab family protein